MAFIWAPDFRVTDSDLRCMDLKAVRGIERYTHLRGTPERIHRRKRMVKSGECGVRALGAATDGLIFFATLSAKFEVVFQCRIYYF